MSPKSLCTGREIATSKLTCVQMGSIKQALEMFKLDNGIYPSTKEGLDALVKNPNNKKYPNYSTYPYLEKLPLDYLGNPFRYNFYKIDKRRKFEIIGFGADGRYGGEEGLGGDIIYPDCLIKYRIIN